MPKVTLTNAQKQRETLAKFFKHKMIDRDMTVSDVAKATNISRSSLYKKLDDPDGFSFGELLRLQMVLHFTFSELVEELEK